MSTLSLRIKHSSKVYDVSVAGDALGEALKATLQELTGVPIAKQKIMLKGKQLANDVTIAESGIKDGQTLFMLGTAPKDMAPPPPVLSASEKVPPTVEEVVPVGLVNTGNTCYANSTLQALHTVPELNAALQSYSGNDMLVKSWASLTPHYGTGLKTPTEVVVPTTFLAMMRGRLPQFAEKDENGMFKQQDAEELVTQLMSQLQSIEAFNKVTESFVGRFTTTRSTDQDALEETFTKLMCHITAKTNFLKDGLRQSLIDEIETTEGSGEHYTLTKQISKLPKYLTVQFVRFFWRKDTKQNSKILRKVTFPTTLDIGDLCTEDLQACMAPAREAYRELELAIEEGQRAQRRARFRRIDAVPGDAEDAENVAAAKRQAAEAEEMEDEKQKQKVEQLKQQFKQKVNSELASDESCSPHGLYDLQAIITHQGMSADSGHYQCFVRNHDKKDSWWRFNDDKVMEVDDNRIAQLAGGGASDSALILLYKSSEY